MIRERHVWKRVIDLDNCRAAVLDEANTPRCRRRGLSAEMREDVDRFAKEARSRLADGFAPQKPVEFDLCEYGKTRHIEAPTVADAICHRAATRIMEPLVYKRMVATSYCPVTGRGGLKLARDLRRMIRRVDETCRIHNLDHKQPWKTWVLKSDIYHFFPSVTFDVAMAAMERVFSDGDALGYLAASLDKRGGLPIGAGFSAMVANAVLIPMDLAVVGRKDVRGYVRYMDDTVAVVRSKKAAEAVHEEIEDALSRVGLTTARKWSKFPAAHHAVEMGGWRVTHDGIYPSSRVERHLRRLLKGDVANLSEDGRAALASLYGYVKNGDSLTLKEMWRQKDASRVFHEV